MDAQQKYDKEHGIMRCLWCIDSETGEECLVDLYTSAIVAKRKNGKLLDPETKNA